MGRELRRIKELLIEDTDECERKSEIRTQPALQKKDATDSAGRHTTIFQATLICKALMATVSRCAAETETGVHVLVVDGYSLYRGVGVGCFLQSASFTVGGYDWRIVFYPDGIREEHRDSVSIGLKLASKTADVVRASFTLAFPNLAVDESTRSMPPPVAFSFRHNPSAEHWLRAVNRSALESSGCIVGDRLCIKCLLTVVKEPRVPAEAVDLGLGCVNVEPLPPSNTIAAHLGKLLETKDVSADVTFEVDGEEIPAHKLVLAMRSPVFMAELYGQMMEKDMARIPVADMQPAVFRALLHFIYNDSLPELDGDDRMEMLRHLLVAADRYAIERLKIECESLLCKALDVNSVATTLALADQHSCARLKDACIRFFASSTSHRIDGVMASHGYAELKRSRSPALVEMLERSIKIRRLV